MNFFGLFALLTLLNPLVHGFRSETSPRRTMFASSLSLSSPKARIHSTRCFAIPQDEEAIKKLLDGVTFDGKEPEIVRLDPDADEIDGSIFEDLETGQPSEMMVMKELLGINIFTYLLGALIVVFLSLNFFLGPGWLGQSIGLQGTGTFTEVSKTLPDTVDLSRPEFRLDF